MKNNAKDQPNTISKDLYINNNRLQCYLCKITLDRPYTISKNLYMKFLEIYTKLNIHEIFKNLI
jgi:hypothetical protein